MDNSPAVEGSAGAWGPKLLAVAAAALVALFAAGGATWFALSGDQPGTVLLGVIAVFFTALTAHGALVRPRLVADRDGVLVRTASARRAAPWALVHDRVVHTRRFGREVPTLEIDIDEDPAGEAELLVVLGQLELGAHPVEVFDELRARRG